MHIQKQDEYKYKVLFIKQVQRFKETILQNRDKLLHTTFEDLTPFVQSRARLLKSLVLLFQNNKFRPNRAK